MRQFGYLISIIIAIILTSCKRSNPDFELLSEIEGTWEMKFDESAVLEKWIKVNDTLYSGQSFEVSNGDTIVTETLQLLCNEDGIFYIPTVKDQNEGNPVSFKMTNRQNSRFVFENPNHNFPTSIVYEFLSDNRLNASVSGIIGGETRSLDFEYVKVE